MALTPPDTDDLLTHMRLTAWTSATEEEYADTQLQLAADLLQAASGVSEDPEDEVAFRIAQAGMMAMAHALIVRSADRSAEYTPFQSERIGSYSYSKMVRAATTQTTTGVDLFDIAVEYLRETGGFGASAWTSSESVFEMPMPPTEEELRQSLGGADAYGR